MTKTSWTLFQGLKVESLIEVFFGIFVSVFPIVPWILQVKL